MTDENKEGSEELEYDIVEAPPTDEVRDTAPKEEDERLRQSDDDEDEDDSSGREQETPEQRSERRKEERRKRKERQRKAEHESKVELQRLREHNEFLGSKMQQLEAVALRNEARAVDQRMFDAKNRYNYAERSHAEAIARGDGIGASKALRDRDEAAHAYRDAEGLQARLAEFGQQQQPQRQQPQPQQRGPDPRVASKATAFIEKHSWIDPTGQKDQDSAVARAIDVRLQQEGYDPTQDEYWEALEKRLEKSLPHRFKAAGRASPPVSGGSDRAGSGRKTFVISPDRKKALQEAGDWDDPARRNKMIRIFAEYDAKSKSTATR